MVAVTGCSGSGKSSLVFDTIYAEGRRQYLETLSLRARQLFRQLERPDVDLIDGLQPTICIDQFPVTRNPRATVATATELHDYFRILFARLGKPFCLHCNEPIACYSLEAIQAELMSMGEETRLVLLSPHVRDEEGDHRQVLSEFRKRGYLRARIDGELVELDDCPALDPSRTHSIELVVDRIIVRGGVEKRLAESIRLAADNPFSQVVVMVRERRAETWTEHRFSTRYACPDCGFAFPAIEPRHFNPSSPYGACSSCQGLGRVERFSQELVFADAAGPLTAQPVFTAAPDLLKSVTSFLEKLKLPADIPWQAIPESGRRKLWEGCGRPRFAGLSVLLQQQLATATDRDRLQELASYQAAASCAVCEGTRLGEVGRSVRLGGLALGELLRRTVADAASYFRELTFPAECQPLVPPLVEPIRQRLEFLLRVGVGYLSLDRRADSLSGGELQRIRLANAIGTSLAGVCYVLDEPSIGLHPRDNERLIAALRELARRGNTVIVVEHDLALVAAAEHIIDMGPGAGPEGGEIVATGSADQLGAVAESVTGRYISGAAAVPVPRVRRSIDGRPSLRIEGVATHNLREVDVSIPLGVLVCVTGVSGSGKSSLVHGTLAPAIRRELGSRHARPGPYSRIEGVERITQLVTVDQSPIGRTPRSNPATYTGLFDEIRKVYAQTRSAKQRGFSARRFSFNHAAGRCEVCRGYGVRKIEMGVLADLHVPCDRCGGRRFNRQTLQVRYRHKTIADVLEMPVGEALEFFSALEKIAAPLRCLLEVGLGYLRLGQAADTLSGGEAQRVKLATELARPARGDVLYLLDEPTTGLHLADIEQLLGALGRLIDQGHSVIVIEHQLDVIKTADWVIDLGPEGGAEGGRIVAAGTPESIAASQESLTGRYLRQVLSDIATKGVS